MGDITGGIRSRKPTDNAMSKRKMTKRQTVPCKMLHRKLKSPLKTDLVISHE